MYDIVLINPPMHLTEIFIPKGIYYLHQILIERGYKSKLLDLEAEFHLGAFSMENDFLEKAIEYFYQYPARIFGFSIWNISYPWAVPMAASLKKIYPECKIVMGGPLATLVKERILQENPTVDVVAIREGEKIITPLVQALLSNNESALSDVNNIFYRAHDNTIHSTPETSLLENLDSLPVLEFKTSYYYKSRFFNLEVGRGCAYKCTFCAASYLWLREPRFMTAQKITELAQYYCDKMKGENIEEPIIHFEHDNFLFKKELFKEIMKIKKEKKFDFAYGFAARIDLMDDEIINMMAGSNCRYIYIGLESGSERIQKLIKKHINLNRAIEQIKKIKARGIQIAANFMVGFPEETLDDLFLTLKLMARLSGLGVIVKANLLHPEPCTPIAASLRPADYVIIKTSPFFKKLKSCNIEPESYSIEMVNHLYAVKNPNFDINIMDRFLGFYLIFLLYFPLSASIIIKTNEHPFEQMYSRFQAGFHSLSDVTASLKFIFSFLLELVDLQETVNAAVLADVIHFEAFRAQKATGVHLTLKEYINEEETEKLYRSIADSSRPLTSKNNG